jgi:hypothetical protein
MQTIFITLTAVFAAATLVTLLVGLFSMAKGSDFNKRNGNKLMRYRVIFQGLTVLSFVGYLIVR